MTCDLVTPGPQQGVALFAVDDCYNPVYGTDAGFYDDCASVAGLTPVTADTRPEFIKPCPNGDLRAYVPARTVTTTSDLVLNFPWLPVEFLAIVGAATPITFKDEVIGWTDCDEAVKLLALVYQELLGNDACGGGEMGARSVVTAVALRDVRLSHDGDFGTSAFNFTLIGKSVKADIGSGPIPLMFDSDDPDTPAWADQCIQTCAKGATFKAWGPPTECGIIDTVAPEDACTPAS